MHIIVPLALAALTQLGPGDPPSGPVDSNLSIEIWALIIGAILILLLFGGRHLWRVARG